VSEPFIPTDEQQAIIGHERSAFITACPGAGKTRVLVERARKLLRDKTHRKGVAFLSFTRAAVGELENRLRAQSLLTSPSFPHYIGTFDSFLWQFFIAPFGIPGVTAPPRLVPDKNDRLIQPYPNSRELPLSCFDLDTGQIIAEKASRLGYQIGNLSQDQAYVTAAQTNRRRFLGRGELDFQEIRQLVKARLANADFSKRLGLSLASRFGEVIVDEAQDCNPTDLEIIQWLKSSGIVTKVICDPYQSIYKFRGGVTDQLLAFKGTFDTQDQVSMTGNFRSSPNICKAIVNFRSCDARSPIDEAPGIHRGCSTPVQILSYRGGVSSAIGLKFQGLIADHGLDPLECPVVAKTNTSAINSVGGPSETGTQNLTMRLAMAVATFYQGREAKSRKLAMDEVHKIVLQIEGKLDDNTYHQYLTAAQVAPNMWRPYILELISKLRYDAGGFANIDAWLDQARRLLAPHLPVGGRSIAQMLQNNSAVEAVFLAIPDCQHRAQTIHSVKGLEFPAVCVVMTNTSKGILDYLADGSGEENAESAREIYVAASRAQQVLAIAAPRSQASRLATHIASLGAVVTTIQIDENTE